MGVQIFTFLQTYSGGRIISTYFHVCQMPAPPLNDVAPSNSMYYSWSLSEWWGFIQRCVLFPVPR